LRFILYLGWVNAAIKKALCVEKFLSLNYFGAVIGDIIPAMIYGGNKMEFLKQYDRHDANCPLCGPGPEDN
jgi:hypothetical protein